MIKKASYFPGKVVFEDEENNRVYRRVAGALAWPEGEQAGRLAVVGEGLTAEPGLGTRPLWLLAEAEGATVRELHREAQILGRRCAVDLWLTDLARPEELTWWLHLEQEQQPLMGRPPLYLAPAAYTGAGVSLGQMLQLLDEQWRPERKVLTLGPGSAAAAQRQALTPEDLGKPARNWPVMAALGYAVAELVLNGEPEEWQAAPQHRTLKDYRPGGIANRGR